MVKAVDKKICPCASHARTLHVSMGEWSYSATDYWPCLWSLLGSRWGE